MPETDPNKLIFPASSNVKIATFEPETGVVTVQFANGESLRYSNFNAELLKEWSAAKSAGGWFHSNVRQHPEKYGLLGPSETPPASDGPVDHSAHANDSSPAPIPGDAMAGTKPTERAGRVTDTPITPGALAAAAQTSPAFSGQRAGSGTLAGLGDQRSPKMVADDLEAQKPSTADGVKRWWLGRPWRTQNGTTPENK